MKQNCKSLGELLNEISPYINQSALARITGINQGQMRQYASGVRNPSQQTIDKIVENLNKFGLELSKIKIE
jgi:transcriptional regulator with XRE-family HTH domain